MFIRKKIVNGGIYYAVVENQRTNDGRVKQRVVVSLGDCSTIEAALTRYRESLAVSLRNERCWRGKQDVARRERYRREIEKLEHALSVVSKQA
jgi:hypothetical protein